MPTKSISENTEIQNNGILIIEGVGLFRPNLLKYFTLKMWIDVPLDVASSRGKKRDRDEYHNPNDACWDGIWKDNDIEYFEKCKPKELADIIISN